MMRVMSVSTLRADYDLKMMECLTRDIDGRGIWWLKTQASPWRAETLKQNQCWPVAQGRYMVALITRPR
jgi:hypothetical protein